MAHSWQEYQEEAAEFFRQLGLDAQTNVTLSGVRTTHDIDVVVKSHHIGFDITWLVECKHWKTPINKLHVLALREIVADLGADRGILLSESGFQSGAEEAAKLTNVQLTSLAALEGTAKPAILTMRLRELYDLVGSCSERYWDIPKSERIRVGLRGYEFENGPSGQFIVKYAGEVIQKAFRGIYPFVNDSMFAIAIPGAASQFESLEEVLAELDPLLTDLDARLNAYAKEMAKAHDCTVSAIPDGLNG